MHEISILLGKFTSQVRDEMSYEELLDWAEFLERRPIGWREDNRTAMLARLLGADKEPGELFSSLSSIANDTKVESNKLKTRLLAFTNRAVGNNWEVNDVSVD